MQVSCHACPAHVHSARTQPVCIEHLMVRWLVLLHGCGEAAGGSATSCLQHVPVSMLPQLCQSACILLTTCAPPAITGRSGPTYFLAVSTKLPACGNSWQPPRHWWEYLLQYFQDRKYCKYHDLASCGICSICSRPAGRVSLNALTLEENLQVRRPLGHCRLSLTRAAALCPRCLRSTPSASLAPSAPRRARAGMDPTTTSSM